MMLTDVETEERKEMRVVSKDLVSIQSCKGESLTFRLKLDPVQPWGNLSFLCHSVASFNLLLAIPMLR